MSEVRGRYTRGYLSHIEAGRQPQFVTWRLKDSLSGLLYAKWKSEVSNLSEKERTKELHRRVEQHLDIGEGSQLLKNPLAAHIVQDALIFGHPERYVLHAWVIMPTHVHSLMSPQEGWPLSRIMKSLKGFTSRQTGEVLNLPGQLWQEESYDVLVCSEKQFSGTWNYIERNPVKAGLCVDPKDWPYGSASEVAREKLAARSKAHGLDVDV